MRITNDSELFNFYIKFVIDALKLQDKSLVESLEDLITTLFGSKYTKDILRAAVFQLAETDHDTCRWALRNFYNLKLHRALTEEIVKFVTPKLISQGFILGQDFSASANGGIFITKNAKAALIENTLDINSIFFEEVLQGFD